MLLIVRVSTVDQLQSGLVALWNASLWGLSDPIDQTKS